MAADVGNTQTVIGVYDGEELVGSWRMATEAHRMEEEVGASCAGLLGLRGIGLDDISAMIVSSDVPPLLRAYKNLAEGMLGVPFYSVGPEMETGLANCYDDPSQVGSDRIVNSVAASRLYGLPVIIVDFGTATSVEAVDAEASYRGGALMPGIYISLEALASRAAKLANVDLEEKTPRAIATNTPDSLRSGFIYGYAGAVDALIARFTDELAAEAPPQDLKVIATGGLASTIVRHCQRIDRLDPDLNLKGLRVLYKMNA